MGSNLNTLMFSYVLAVDENNRIHCYGRKNMQATASYNYFYIILNSDGTTYKNLSYSDNPATTGNMAGYGGCLTKDYSIGFGFKKSTTYSVGKPHIFVFDKVGTLQRSIWGDNSNTLQGLYYGYNIPETNQVVLTDDDTVNTSGFTRFVNYDAAANSIIWNFSLNTFAQRNSINAFMSKIVFDSSNNMFIIGYNKTNKNLIQIIKMNQSKQVLWTKTYSKDSLVNSVRGCTCVNNKLYITVYDSTNTLHILDIDCSTGNINTEWKNKNSSTLLNNTVSNNSLYNITNVNTDILLTKLNLQDLYYHQHVELMSYYNMYKTTEYTAATLTGTTVTNYTDITFTTATYLTATALTISNTALSVQTKLEGIYY
jgi:hypothetical protein